MTYQKTLSHIQESIEKIEKWQKEGSNLISKVKPKSSFRSMVNSIRPHVEGSVSAKMGELVDGGDDAWEQAAREYSPMMEVIARSLSPGFKTSAIERRRQIANVMPNMQPKNRCGKEAPQEEGRGQVTATEQYVNVLTSLKTGELGLLRTHAGQGLDETVDGFDLFTGLWWPLRQKNERAPRREVAWLIAKLYASRPLEHSPGETLACQLRRCQPDKEKARERFRQKFDEMLSLPLNNIEPTLRWALDLVASKNLKLDWVKLTDDLSIWERESTRLKWAEQFLNTNKGGQSC